MSSETASPSESAASEITDAREIARAFVGMMRHARELLDSEEGESATSRALTGHLGTALTQAVIVHEAFPTFQHVSVQRAVDAYVSERGTTADWLGLRIMHREHQDLASALLVESRTQSQSFAAPDYTSAADGPDSTREVLSYGLLCTHAPGGEPIVVAMTISERHGPPQVHLDILCAQRAPAAATLERLRTLVAELDVVRGQVISFGVSENYGNSLVTFLPRADLGADDVILPDGLLDRITDYVIGTAQHADALRRNGIHLKRGLLLYGPPGTGKTHLVRYLTSQAAEATVVILSGNSMRFIQEAAAIARRLTPAMVVIEDVDLVAQDREYSPTGNPFLFTLLDAMDGVGGDADITFLLTTNRVRDLEEAVVQRPGRIDLAIEVPRPDAGGREQLLRMYAGSAHLEADLAPAVAATEGATASAMKELMRRAVLIALGRDRVGDDGGDREAPVIDDEVLGIAVGQFTTNRDELQRAFSGEAAETSGWGEPAPEPGQGRQVSGYTEDGSYR